MPNFSTSCQFKNCSFRGQRDGEEIILLLRSHWFVLFLRYLPLFFVAAFILFVAFNGSMYATASFFSLDVNLFYLTLSFISIIFWLVAFIIWVDYYLDVWIVTDQRIINMEQFGLFRREISELDHRKIQDVSTEVKGILPTLLKYGFVYIQTAGEKARFIFKQIPDPQKVKSVIMELQKHEERKRLKREGEILRGKE